MAEDDYTRGLRRGFQIAREGAIVTMVGDRPKIVWTTARSDLRYEERAHARDVPNDLVQRIEDAADRKRAKKDPSSG